MPTNVSRAAWDDPDRKESMLETQMALIERIRQLEATVATQQQSIVTITARLGLINAILHLW